MREDRLRVALIAGGILVISAGHYLTPQSAILWHNLFQRLYFLPIVYAALTFGWLGGLVAALCSALCYIPHIMTWHHDPAYSASQYAEIVLFFLVALLTGVLADRERKRREQLDRIYRQLQDSFEQLKRADRLSAVGQLSAGLAHEIRNPLASIEGAVDILERHQGPGGQQSEFLGIIKKEVQRLNGLLSGLLDFARPRPPQVQQVDLHHVMNKVVNLTGHTGDRKGISIEVQAGDDLPSVEGDAEQLQQVLLNLTLNAIQAMPDGGTILISADRDKTGCAIRVVDEGEAVAAENLDHIFDPFYTTKPTGTGLGLAVVHQIIARHGGTIEAIRNRDRGMTFLIRLPSTYTGNDAAVR